MKAQTEEDLPSSNYCLIFLAWLSSHDCKVLRANVHKSPLSTQQWELNYMPCHSKRVTLNHALTHVAPSPASRPLCLWLLGEIKSDREATLAQLQPPWALPMRVPPPILLGVELSEVRSLPLSPMPSADMNVPVACSLHGISEKRPLQEARRAAAGVASSETLGAGGWIEYAIIQYKSTDSLSC